MHNGNAIVSSSGTNMQSVLNYFVQSNNKTTIFQYFCFFMKSLAKNTLLSLV